MDEIAIEAALVLIREQFQLGARTCTAAREVLTIDAGGPLDGLDLPGVRVRASMPGIGEVFLLEDVLERAGPAYIRELSGTLSRRRLASILAHEMGPGLAEAIG
jgi:hypothetical protein